MVQAGDCLYIPRGVAHEAATLDAAALHVTVGIEVMDTWCKSSWH